MTHLAWVRGSAVAALFALGAMGCSSGRDVEVKGEVVAPSTLSVQGKIVVEFEDVIAEDEREIVHSVELDAPGSFSENVALEGDKVLVRAIADANGDGACSDGEAWAEREVEIAEDDTIEPISLTLAAAPCPATEG